MEEKGRSVLKCIEDNVIPCCLAKHIGQTKQKYKGRTEKNWSQIKISRTAHIAQEKTHKQTHPCLLLSLSQDSLPGN